MARPKLSSPDQPPLVRLPLRLYEALASLKLAVVVIVLSAAVLGWATFIERDFGAAAVRFGIYGAWWFAGLLGLLGLNVLCAALIRFPWKRHQTGFVITHTGILVLLIGCWLSRLGGIDAQMPIFEGTTAGKAFENSQHFELTIYRPATGSPGEAPSEESETIRVPFASGPFNWQDYGSGGVRSAGSPEPRRLSAFPWRLAQRDRGLIYDRDGIQIEVLNYFSDSRAVLARPLVLSVRKAGGPQTASPTEVPLTIEMTAGLGHRVLAAAWKPLPQEQRATFWMARTDDELYAFLHGEPQGEPGPQGQLVLMQGSKKFVFDVDRLRLGERLPLGETGLEAELVAVDLSQAGDDEVRKTLGQIVPPATGTPAFLHLRIHGPAGPREMLVPASLPALEIVLDDGENLRRLGTWETDYGLFATFWGVPKPDAPSPRLDLMQGPDGILYGRTWDGRRYRALGEISARGGDEPTVAFGGTDRAVALAIGKFERQDRPGAVIRPVPFGKKRSGTHRALVRVTVDGKSDEFWLQAMPQSQFPDPPADDQRLVIQGEGRRVAMRLQPDAVDVGFDVHLHQFDRRLDPGTSMASHYSSLIDVLERPDEEGGPPRPLHENVVVTLNNPKNFSDPQTGRSYRLFQESFMGPWKPTDPIYRRYNPPGQFRDQFFQSTLTVNYDPGRGLKYTGSLLIVAGIVVMFYMRAYFFKPRGQQPSTARIT